MFIYIQFKVGYAPTSFSLLHILQSVTKERPEILKRSEQKGNFEGIKIIQN
jgi:hypothetical protein